MAYIYILYSDLTEDKQEEIDNLLRQELEEREPDLTDEELPERLESYRLSEHMKGRFVFNV